MTDYTPDTDEVREVWVWQDYENGYHGPCPRDPAEFDRWLAEHDAELSANASANSQSAYDRGYRDSDRDWRQAGDGKGLT